MSQGVTPPVCHRMLASLGDVEAGVGGLAEGNCWSLSDADLGRLFDRLAAVESRLAAVKLAAVAEADGRNIGVSGATSTAGWLRARVRMHPGEARRTVALAKAVRSDCAATGVALAAAQVNAEQARVIAQVLGDLPPVDAAVQVKAEEFLIGQAAVLETPGGVRWSV